MERRKVKNDEKSPWDNVLPDQFQTVAAVLASDWCQKTSGKTLPQGLFSPFITFLRAIFSRPFRLSFAPFICPWVSEDDWNAVANDVLCCY